MHSIATPAAAVVAAASALLLAACAAPSSSSDGAGTSSPVTSQAPSPPVDPSPTVVAAAPTIDPGDGGDYQPNLDPAQFTAEITNPYLPLTPGSRWVYRARTAEGVERIVVTVTGRRRTIMGVPAVVVRDTVTLDGQLVEDTDDWYAQDSGGNVWYLGEDTTEFDNGKPVSKAGSWEAGVDGAQPGLVMEAEPQVGDAYRQEYLPGEAEDLAQVVATGRTARALGARHRDGMVTKEWTPLEPTVVELKTYIPGIGQVGERTVAGGAGSVRLVAYRRGG